MICVADDHVTPFPPQPTGDCSQSFLVLPGKNVCVVCDKTVVTVSDRIWRIEIYQVASPRSGDSLSKIFVGDFASREGCACSEKSFLGTSYSLVVAAIGHIEMALGIRSMNSIEREATQID
jgi:hypothetical protein